MPIWVVYMSIRHSGPSLCSLSNAHLHSNCHVEDGTKTQSQSHSVPQHKKTNHLIGINWFASYFRAFCTASPPSIVVSTIPPRPCLQKTSPVRQSFKHNDNPPHLRHLGDEFLIKWFPSCFELRWPLLHMMASCRSTRSSLLFIIIGGSLLLCNTFSRLSFSAVLLLLLAYSVAGGYMAAWSTKTRWMVNEVNDACRAVESFFFAVEEVYIFTFPQAINASHRPITAHSWWRWSLPACWLMAVNAC